METLDIKNEISTWLKRISDRAFASPYDISCRQGGVSGLRTALSSERAR